MNCANCGEPLSEARQAALPSETWCARCVEESGDVERTTGVMVWDHKTAPTLITGHAAKTIRSYDRRGFHAALPFNSYENPRLQASRRAQQELQDVKAVLHEKPPPEFDLVTDGTSVIPSRCHPNRPRATPDDKCVECAVAWYAKHGKRA
jgi:hypothetical protein